MVDMLSTSFLDPPEPTHTSSSLDVKRATSSTDGGAGLAEGGAIVGGCLPGGAPGGGRRLPGSPGGEALAFASVVGGDAGGGSWGKKCIAGENEKHLFLLSSFSRSNSLAVPSQPFCTVGFEQGCLLPKRNR